jgi:hypothetical protein
MLLMQAAAGKGYSSMVLACFPAAGFCLTALSVLPCCWLLLDCLVSADASASTAACLFLHLLLLLLLQAASANGYSSMVLETLQGLRGAVALYAKLGFTRTSSYCVNPLPGELCCML